MIGGFCRPQGQLPSCTPRSRAYAHEEPAASMPVKAIVEPFDVHATTGRAHGSREPYVWTQLGRFSRAIQGHLRVKACHLPAPGAGRRASCTASRLERGTWFGTALTSTGAATTLNSSPPGPAPSSSAEPRAWSEAPLEGRDGCRCLASPIERAAGSGSGFRRLVWKNRDRIQLPGALSRSVHSPPLYG